MCAGASGLALVLLACVRHSMRAQGCTRRRELCPGLCRFAAAADGRNRRLVFSESGTLFPLVRDGLLVGTCRSRSNRPPPTSSAPLLAWRGLDAPGLLPCCSACWLSNTSAYNERQKLCGATWQQAAACLVIRLHLVVWV